MSDDGIRFECECSEYFESFENFLDHAGGCPAMKKSMVDGQDDGHD